MQRTTVVVVPCKGRVWQPWENPPHLKNKILIINNIKVWQMWLWLWQVWQPHHFLVDIALFFVYKRAFCAFAQFRHGFVPQIVRYLCKYISVNIGQFLFDSAN